ncbi:MAG: P22 coat protein - protein 5 domain protein [Armatimonadetes bacterium]|nr:P22 coat protein - protein 5 domain protein [Armatimonadota bacterium]
MSLSNFIPEVWAARLLHNLHKTQVFGQPGVMNRDYEGDIRGRGDTVRIHAIGPVSVADYTRDTDIAAPQTLTDAETTLVIDRARYVNFQIDDVDRAQQAPKVMDSAMRESAYALADDADQYLAGLHTQIAAGNFIGSDADAEVPTAQTLYEFIVDLGVLLDEADAPRSGRFCVLPPWCYGLLLKDDRFVKAGTVTSDRVLRNGEVGQAAGMTIYVSNNVANTGGALYKIVAGVPDAWTFAQQVRDVEAYRPPLRFADAVKALHLYGAKVTRPSALACLVASKS